MTIITITFSISIVGVNRWPPSQVTASGRRAAVTHCGRRTWNRAAAQIRSTLPLPSADDDTSLSHVCSEHTWSSCRCHLHAERLRSAKRLLLAAALLFGNLGRVDMMIMDGQVLGVLYLCQSYIEVCLTYIHFEQIIFFYIFFIN